MTTAPATASHMTADKDRKVQRLISHLKLIACTRDGTITVQKGFHAFLHAPPVGYTMVKM
jgi:hypothetical protein